MLATLSVSVGKLGGGGVCAFNYQFLAMQAINKPTHPPERPTSPVHHLGSLQLCSVGRLSDTGRYNLQSPDMIV